MTTLSLPMLVRGDELITGRVPKADGAASSGWSYTPKEGLFGGAIEMCQQIEGDTGGIAAGVLIGNAFTDVPALCTNVLIVREQSQKQQSIQDCQRIGEYMWENRESFQADLTSVADAITIAEESMSVTRGSLGPTVTVFSDAA
eukprot:SAG31_NODE_1023_length_10298_cov_3.003530_6_plen_144_part_00